MRVFCYAYEGMYHGLHGICDYGVMDFPDNMKEAIEELNLWGDEASEQLIYSYGLEDEYELEEDESIEDTYAYQDRGWYGHKIRDDVELSTVELDRLCCELGPEYFIEEYCEKESI